MLYFEHSLFNFIPKGLMMNPIDNQEFIEIIKVAVEKDERVKICYKFHANKALQIQLNNNECFNLRIIKLDDAYKIKRKRETFKFDG